jgi:hypothetical protein
MTWRASSYRPFCETSSSATRSPWRHSRAWTPRSPSTRSYTIANTPSPRHARSRDTTWQGVIENEHSTDVDSASPPPPPPRYPPPPPPPTPSPSPSVCMSMHFFSKGTLRSRFECLFPITLPPAPVADHVQHSVHVRSRGEVELRLDASRAAPSGVVGRCRLTRVDPLSFSA